MVDVSELARKHSEVIANTIEYCLREYMLENYYGVERLKWPQIDCTVRRTDYGLIHTYCADGQDIFRVECNGLEVRMVEYWR